MKKKIKQITRNTWYCLLYLTYVTHSSCGPPSASARLSYSSAPPALQWPVYRESYPNIPYLNSTFAESRQDHFHNGLDLGGVAEIVYPMAAGKLLYSYYRKRDAPHKAVIGPGNIAIVDHGKGWWSGYYHLKRVFDPSSSEHKIEAEKGLAQLGNTGRSSGYHLHFFLSAHYGRQAINPLHHLPPVRDTRPPKIKALVFSTPTSTTRILATKTKSIRLTRQLPVYLEAEDPGQEKGSRRGLYWLKWQCNEQGTQQYRFDSLDYRRGHYFLKGKPFNRVFKGRLYSLGKADWKHGLNTVSIEAKDYAGNTSKETFRFEVIRQY